MYLIRIAIQLQEDGLRRFNRALYSHCQDIVPLIKTPTTLSEFIELVTCQ
jgi:hypothetical protein